jgi:hypothetical protein
MRKIVQGLGFLLFQPIRFLLFGLRIASNVFLDAVYGPPILAAAVPKGAKPRIEGDFQPTIAVARVGSMPDQPASAFNKNSTNLVLRPAEATQSVSPPDVSERVHLAEVVGPGGLVYGVMWLYLYPERRIAKRVFKVTDRWLAKSLKTDRYFMEQVPFDPKVGSMPVMKQMHKEVGKLLDQRATFLRDKRPVVPAVAAPAPVVAAPAPARQPPRPAAAPVATPVAAPVAKAPRDFRRNVVGEVYEGVVTVAGMTTKNGGANGSYKTFCLTLNDGQREVPLYGTELERQVHDLKIECGERVKVVFMGKTPTDVPGKGTVSKNLYQVTRTAS